MVLKTFNVQQDTYQKFSKYCKEHGISMSKQVELFMESFMAEEPGAKKEFLDKIERARKGNFVKLKTTLAKRYGVE